MGVAAAVVVVVVVVQVLVMVVGAVAAAAGVLLSRAMDGKNGIVTTNLASGKAAKICPSMSSSNGGYRTLLQGLRLRTSRVTVF